MRTLTQTLTITYPHNAQTTKDQFEQWVTDQLGVGNVLGWRNVQREGSVGDVRGKCPDTVPEWHTRNLVT